MGPGLQERKEGLRQGVRRRMAALSKEALESGSVRACENVRAQGAWQKAQGVMFYAPTSRELDVWPLLREAVALGKLVALPRFDASKMQYEACRVRDLASDLTRGRYGIWEPGAASERVVLNRLDLILVPGVAFDLHGRRLGRGKGFYDRLLAAVRGTTCGVAFDEQIVDEVPVEPHDSDVNCILTPTRWIEL